MNRFSKSSQEKLSTCHPLLQELMELVLQDTDITILCGHRNEADQNKAYAEGNSKVRWPKSEHNKLPSMAVDIAPAPIDWQNTERFRKLRDVVFAKWLMIPVQERNGWQLEAGADWKHFTDLPHFQISKL